MKKEQIRNELFKIEVLRQRLMRPQFIALGLTVGQGQPRILKELLFEGSMTQKKLADACLLDVTTMSRTLDRMEQAGLLVRESNPDCRRSWLIALTDKGTDIAKKVQQIFEETDKIYCSNLSEKEAEQLFVLLQKVFHRTVNKNFFCGCPHFCGWQALRISHIFPVVRIGYTNKL